MGWFLIERESKYHPMTGEQSGKIIYKERDMISDSQYRLTSYDGEFLVNPGVTFIGYTDSIKIAKDFLTDKIRSEPGYIMNVLYMKEGHQIHRPMTKEEIINNMMPNDITFTFVDRDGVTEDEEKDNK